MAGLSPAGETAVLASILGSPYISLHTSDPGTAGASEVTGDPAYARQSASFTNAGSNPTVASNAAVVSFAAATANWGTVFYFGIWSAASGGTFRGSGAITAPKPINIGDQMRFLTGALTVTAQ